MRQRRRKKGVHTHTSFSHTGVQEYSGNNGKGRFRPPSLSSLLLPPPPSPLFPPSFPRLSIGFAFSRNFGKVPAIFLLTRVGESHSFFLGKNYDIRPSRSRPFHAWREGGRAFGRRMSLPHKPKGKKRHKKDPENRGDSTTVDD